jgi:hypothetical protein
MDSGRCSRAGLVFRQSGHDSERSKPRARHCRKGGQSIRQIRQEGRVGEETPLSNRGRALLFAQRKGEPLGTPPTHLDHAQLQAWADIVAASPDVLRSSDRLWVEMASMLLAHWRSGSDRTMERLRMNYRALGKLLMPMAARRRLMFGFRH